MMKNHADKVVNMGFTSERFPVGTHMCYVYNDDSEHRKITAQYINAGLEENEFVGYFADLDSSDLVDSYLREIGVLIPEDRERENILFEQAKKIYCPNNNVFDPKTLIGKFKDLHQNCCSSGFKRLRATGEMSWALAPEVEGSTHLAEYESRLNILFETHPYTAICQYDARKFDGETIFEILKVHPMMVVKGQVVHNPHYVDPREYLMGKGLSPES